MRWLLLTKPPPPVFVCHAGGAGVLLPAGRGAPQGGSAAVSTLRVRRSERRCREPRTLPLRGVHPSDSAQRALYPSGWRPRRFRPLLTTTLSLVPRRFGPLIDGWLWGGAYNARRKLSEYEIETMVTKLEREDIINAVKPEEHGRSSMLRASQPQRPSPARLTVAPSPSGAQQLPPCSVL
jgi:hypothetical protein